MKFVLNDEVASRHNVTFGDLRLGDVFMRNKDIYIKVAVHYDKSKNVNALKLSSPVSSLVYLHDYDMAAKYVGDDIYLNEEDFIDTY